MKNNPPKIFISFSHKDEFIVKSFVKNILVAALNFQASDIFFTAGEGSKPKSGKDFKEAIKNNLINAKIVFQFVSKNYKESEVCLNEMGAAWVLCDTVIPLLIEDKYDIGFLNNEKQQVRLSKKIELKKLLQDYKEHLNPRKFKLDVIEEYTEIFLLDYKKDEIERMEKTIREILKEREKISVVEFKKITGIEKISNWDANEAKIGHLKLKYSFLNSEYLNEII